MRKKKSAYWIGPCPSNGQCWDYASSAIVFAEDEHKEAVFRIYRRFAKQHNDIYHDMEWKLSEHNHEYHGATTVFGLDRRFYLHWHNADQVHWLLEICFARGFKEYDRSRCGRNALRTTKDIQSIRLHWSQGGREVFDRWLAAEETQCQGDAEWTEYRA